MINHWYKTAVIYSLDIKVFSDADGNGAGDFQGLIQKLDYIASLGITCLWLLPFYDSPRKDNGYDVKDYFNVDPLLGNLGDFVQFIHEAGSRGIRVIVDLVVNHTSIEHPWFVEAKNNRESPYRNYYIWDDDPKEDDQKIMLEGEETSIWEFSEETNSYYLHQYYKHQADLNIANPQVRQEIFKIMGFWLQLGVAGFRVDAAHVVTDPVDVEHIHFGNLHELFTEMRDFLRTRNPEAVLLGEASLSADQLRQYFIAENGSPRMHMLFNFISNKHLFLSFARQKGNAVVKGLKSYKPIVEAHWVNFIRHHDELNLKLLDEGEIKEVWKAFAPEENMRMFGDGIRRRLPPMLENDRKRIELFYVMAFSLPGTPVINFGEEIGMGDNLELEGRESLRTPMQWSEEENAGFSSAPVNKLYRPVINSGEYGYKNINVRSQQSKPDSLLNFFCRLIRLRKQNTVIGIGDWHTLKTSDERAASWYFTMNEMTLLVAFNLSAEKIKTDIHGDIIPVRTLNIFEDYEYQNKASFEDFELNPFGYRWIQILEKREVNILKP